MKTISNSIMILCSILLLSINVHSQNYILNKSNSSLTVSGTSNLHDWDVISNDFSGKIQLKDFTSAEITNLTVMLTSETLKSGKNTMDNKTYKALKTDEFKTISFKMIQVQSNKKIDDLTYEMRLIGETTICGVTQRLPIDLLLIKNGINIDVTGSCAIKMTDFEVDPPTALLGTIKTGDELSIKFNTKFKKL